MIQELSMPRADNSILNLSDLMSFQSKPCLMMKINASILVIQELFVLRVDNSTDVLNLPKVRYKLIFIDKFFYLVTTNWKGLSRNLVIKIKQLALI